MKKRMIWLAAFLVTLLLSVPAFAAPPPPYLPPQSADDVPVPAYTVPSISNVKISGNDVTMDVSGTYNDGGAIIYAVTPSGEQQQYEVFTVTGSGLAGTVTGLPADATSWRISMVCVYNTGTPGADMSFYYDEAGALESYSIQDTTVSAKYHFDSQGRMTYYRIGNMNVSYNQYGSLMMYMVSTDAWEQIYNNQYELITERFRDGVAGTMTELRYDGGVLVYRYVANDDGSQYTYDGNGVLRRSMTVDGDGLATQNLYDVNGNLYSYMLQTDTQYEQYDAEGNLLRKNYDGAAGYIYETYKNGRLVQKTVSGELPDGRDYDDIYENGVYTQRIIYEDDGDYHYDAKGNYTGKTVYSGDEYQEFNADGDLAEYMVYSEQQGGVWLTYNHRNVLQSLEYYAPYIYDIYRYDAKEKVWYLNDVPYDGPVPVALAELKLEKEIVWYPNNTVCSFGPQFRDIDPGLTDLWYMFTPVDVSHDGTQTFELVGGSVYVLGQVSVTVAGDSVTVNYSTIKGKHGNIYMKSEYLNFFPDLASVKTVVPGELGEGFRFGQTISIQKDLGGDTNVLMFVRNVATFCNFADKDTLLRRFYKNLPGRVELRDAMLAMMD